MPRKAIIHPRRKKDFKLRDDIVTEFEHYAPSGKQTAIVEGLIAEWVREQQRLIRRAGIERAYSKRSTK